MRRSTKLATIFSGGAFSPTQIPNLQGWWDTEFSTVTDDGGGLISNVSDLSGNSNDLQSTGALRPSLLTDEIDGKNALGCTNRSMTATNTVSAVTESTIAMVMRTNAVASTAEFIFGNTTGNYGAFHTNGTTPDELSWLADSASTTDATNALRDLEDQNIGTNYRILTFRSKADADTLNTGVIEIYENGYLVAIDTLSSATADLQFMLNARGSLRGDNNFVSVAFWNTRLTDSQLNNVHNYYYDRFPSIRNKRDQASWIPTGMSTLSNDASFRRAIAGGYTNVSSFTSVSEVADMLGDSTVVGFALKANFTAGVTLRTTEFIYDNPSVSYQTAAWNILDCRDAASQNNQGRAQDEGGIEIPLSLDLKASVLTSGNNIDTFKFGQSGSDLATDWTGIRLILYRRNKTRSANRRAMTQNVCQIDIALIVGLGTNDADNSTDAGNVQTNAQTFINFIRASNLGITFNSTRKIAWFQPDSTSASYPFIDTVRTQISALVAANSNIILLEYDADIDGIVGDTTHPDAPWYEAESDVVNTYIRS